MGADFSWSWSSASRDRSAARAIVGWGGAEPVSGQSRVRPRLFLATWNNPQPQIPIKTLDLVSSLTEADVFIVSMTAEP
jgi:hypothetical protein